MENKENDEEDDELLRFAGGWRGLYIFLAFYCVLQVVLLYIFTAVLNQP
jgi:hypothetical protein